MSNALAVRKSDLATTSETSMKAAGKALKKTAKKAAKKSAGPASKKHVAKKHVAKKHAPEGRHGEPPGREEETHEESRPGMGDNWRAFEHLSRVRTLLGAMPVGASAAELRRLAQLAQELGGGSGHSAKAGAEVARALEHLCFAALAGSGSTDTEGWKFLEGAREWPAEHLRREMEKQEKRLARLAKTLSETAAPDPRIGALLGLARQAHAAAGQADGARERHSAHECLRATAALLEAMDGLA